MNKLLVTLLILLLTACGGKSDQPSTERMVKTVVIGEGNSGYQRIYPGRVDAGQKVELSFQVAGTLTEFPVKEGMRVQEGDLLAKLDARDYQNRYDAAKAQLNTTELNYKRAETLVKSGTISQANFDEIQAKYETAKSNASIYEKALKDTALHAPFPGIISKTFVHNFQEVQAKEKILNLQNVDEVDIVIDVPEKDLITREKIHENENQTLKNAHIQFDALGDRKFEVKIKEFATEADRTTQTYRVKLSMKTPQDVNILPGMTANLVVSQEQVMSGQGFAVPVSAVAVDPSGDFYAWLVDEKAMVVHKKLVKVGEMRGDSITVLSGLNAGDRIVVAGVPYLEEGMKVRLFTNGY